MNDGNSNRPMLIKGALATLSVPIWVLSISGVVWLTECYLEAPPEIMPLLQTLIWPSAVVTLAVMFRRQIAQLIARIVKIDTPAGSAELANPMKQFKAQESVSADIDEDM